MEWNQAIALHDRAVTAYATAAAAAPGWERPVSPQKWSPAEITTHLILAFEAILREVSGGGSMQLRTTRVQRFVLRLTIMRRIMRGGAFPRGAPAPRETRPRNASPDAAATIARFQQLGMEVTAAIGEAGVARPQLQLLHPYFGYLSLADALYMSARHIDHHRQQLPQGKSYAPG